MMADWKFTKGKEGHFFIKWTSEQIPELLNQADDFKYFKILKLTEEELVLSFQHKLFSNKLTDIVDVYVEESVNVKDRDFHW